MNTCQTCRFWVRTDENYPSGECRRYAPRRTDGDNTLRFPFTGPECWCGEWAAPVKDEVAINPETTFPGYNGIQTISDPEKKGATP